MLVSEMRRQEATYFLMNWETRGSEQGLTEEWPRGLFGWPGSGTEGKYPLVSSHLASHKDHISLTPQCHRGFPVTLTGLGMVFCNVAHTGHLSGQPTGSTEPAPGD